MKINMKLAITGLIVMTSFLQACGGGGGGGTSAAQKQADSVKTLLESDGSGTWTQVKIDSRIKNYSVFLGPDGRYYAFNTGAYSKTQTKTDFLAAATVYSSLQKSTDTYSAYSVVGTYYSFQTDSCPSSYGDTVYSCVENIDPTTNAYTYDVTEQDYAYVNVNEDIYTDTASGLVFEVGDTSSKDLESVSASIEASSNEAIRDQLVSGYGLSENRATEIASLAKSWQNISKSRAMTSKDLVQFQSKVFGTDLNTLKKAAVKSANGDSKSYDSLIEKAAALNDISPEQAKAIFKDFAN